MSQSVPLVDYRKYLRGAHLSEMAAVRIEVGMTKFLFTVILMFGCAAAQVAEPAASSVTSSDAGRQQAASIADVPLPGGPNRKVSLMRGVLKRMDPIHDQLVIHSFGGGDVRIAFDPRTRFLAENATTRLTSIPVGSVVSVDTVIDNGKLFAASVRTSPSHAAELNGQILRCDPAKSQFTVRDPLSPEQSVSLRITPNTTVVNRGKPASPQALAPGMLVRVTFSAHNAANNIEILAARGSTFSFAGRVVAVDLRSQTLVLSNDSDQSVRELTIGSLDTTSLGLLHEGADVSIQAQFDGDRYNVRTVTPVAPTNQ